ncbi:MAG: beta-lactamase family protein [Gammaproteobacteria bacterium]|nr:beta-lactamase family protein [Gammaproteobacteria bacterium]
MKADVARLERLGRIAQGYIDRGEFPGIAWQVNHGAQLIDDGSVGFADVERQVSLHRETIYRIYSMTKPLVSILCLRLVEQGLLRLADPVADYIDGFDQFDVVQSDGSRVPVKRLMTVEDLLTHRSGLSYDFLLHCPVAPLYRECNLTDDASRSLEQLCAELQALPLASQPGERWQYSLSIDVLARVLEVASGVEFSALMREQLLEPMDMVDTDFRVEESKQHRLAAMYGLKHLSEPVVPAGTAQTLKLLDIEVGYPVNCATFARGGHGLYSTLPDYLKAMQLLETGKTIDGDAYISQPMLQMMWQNRLSDTQRPIGIDDNLYSGYGWNLFGRVMLDVGQASSLTGAGEGGWAGAASTYFWIDRALGFNGIIMTQYLGSLYPLANDIRSAAYQALV